jgi:plastocyanin
MKITLGTAATAALAASLLLVGAVAAKSGYDDAVAVESASGSPSASMAPMQMSPSPSNGPAASAAATGAAVAIKDFSFQPASISVVVGSTVTWTNNDTTGHTVSADDGSFDSGTVAPGATFSHTFDTAGTFTYHCNIHPSMTATITVVPAPAASAPPVPAPSTGPAASAGAGSAVAIKDFSFQPASISVAVGSTVTWTNNDTTGHTVSADEGSFDSGTVAPGATFSQTFDTAGTFTYHCNIHPTMTATITVG